MDTPKKKLRRKTQPRKVPDGRGKRPADPNQLAQWIVDQATREAAKETG